MEKRLYFDDWPLFGLDFVLCFLKHKINRIWFSLCHSGYIVALDSGSDHQITHLHHPSDVYHVTHTAQSEEICVKAQLYKYCVPVQKKRLYCDVTFMFK